MSGSHPISAVDDLQRLGQALNERTDGVVSAMLLRTSRSSCQLDAAIEERFARVGAVSTIAVARWMSGEGAEVAREVGQEAWQIFGQLASQRAAPLNEVTKRCLRWCDAAGEVVRECASQLELDHAVLDGRSRCCSAVSTSRSCACASPSSRSANPQTRSWSTDNASSPSSRPTTPSPGYPT